MTISRSSTRPITVAKVHYRWLETGHEFYVVKLVVEADQSPAQKLYAYYFFDNFYSINIGSAVKCYRRYGRDGYDLISRGVVRAAILAGLQYGWNPHQRGSPVQLVLKQGNFVPVSSEAPIPTGKVSTVRCDDKT